MFHNRCISSNLCKSCVEGDNNSALLTINDLNDYKIFNPYVHDTDPSQFDCDADEYEEFCSTLSTASDILKN